MVLVPGRRRARDPAASHAAREPAGGRASSRSARAATTEIFAIAGGFLQVRPDKVVVMAETADLAAEIDLEKAQEARREAERALEAGFVRGRRPRGRPGAAPVGAAADPGRASGDTARVRAGPARALVADATTVPLGISPRDAAAGGVPDRGRASAPRHRPRERGEERRPQAARGRGPDRRALPARERPRDRGRAGHDRGPAATSASSSTTRRTASTRSPRATWTGCSSRSRRPPRCAPRSSCSARCSPGSGT